MRFLRGVTFSLLAALTLCSSGCGDDDSDSNATPTPAADGPVITFAGLTAADDSLIAPTSVTNDGTPVYSRPFGSGFSLVIEAKPGTNDIEVGDSSYDADLDSLPDLQIASSRDLGNGSAAVCDDPQTIPGGVPAAAGFDDGDIAAVNDFSCRFVDGAGNPLARTASSDSCVAFATGDYAFVDPESQAQFCGFISAPLAFPTGDTTITVRVRDIEGHVGPERRIIVQVQPPPTPTQAPSGPVITFLGLIRADDALIEPDSVSSQGIPMYTRATHSGFSLVVEGKRGASGEAIGLSAYDFDGGSFPDLQIRVSQPLGNGSEAICDDPEVMSGGVPASAEFDDSTEAIAAVNDLSCRFLDGAGSPSGRSSSSDSCVAFPTGDFSFVSPETEVQFCGFINVALAFPTGNTLVTVRLRDVAGNVGP
ncbi:MAG TPA: hypothetical protein VEB21_07370, partial [Terriglobales bacterium]|nr:hypothetical protein [Terriglobales bacterium]